MEFHSHEWKFLGEVARGSLDALHLAAAIRLEVDVVLTYEQPMADAATALGLQVLAPA